MPSKTGYVSIKVIEPAPDPEHVTPTALIEKNDINKQICRKMRRSFGRLPFRNKICVAVLNAKRKYIYNITDRKGVVL